MQFLHPYWLFGLLAIAVPVIIHLFNFRRYRRVYFTNLRFLRDIRNETRRQHRLRHLLVLISRMLVIIFLVLAFARPYIPAEDRPAAAATHFVSIYVDNSMSMQAASGGHRLLDIAKAKAMQVAAAYGPADRFSLLTNDFLGKHQRYYSREEFNTLLSEIDISPAFRKLPEVSTRLQEMTHAGQAGDDHHYYISDFQETSFELPSDTSLSDLQQFFIPVVSEPYGNVYIDSCWFDTPYNHVLQRQSLHLVLVNASDIELEKVPVKFMLGGRQQALGSYDLPPGGSITAELPFSHKQTGLQLARISIEDYPVTWDDHLFLSYEVKKSIPVLAISRGEPAFYLSGLFDSDTVFTFDRQHVNSLDYGVFSNYDLIVLDDVRQLSSGLAKELEEYVSAGGSILLIPGRDADTETYNSFLSAVNSVRLLPYDTSRLMVTGLDESHEIFADVFESIPENPDLPFVRGHFPLESMRGQYLEVIMDLQNGDPYLSLGRHGKGKVYLLTAPMGEEYGNLARHALWVPLMYRMALLSRPLGKLYYTMGADRSVELKTDSRSGDATYRMKLHQQEYEFIPAVQPHPGGSRLLLYDRITKAGHYKLYLSDNLLGGYSFNYSRKESDPAFYGIGEIREMIAARGMDNISVLDAGTERISTAVATLSQGTSLWKLFIWLALAGILFEIILLRLFRK